MRPGEVVYLIADDVPGGILAPEQDPISEDVEETRTDWMTQFLRSVTEAGLARSVTSG